MIPSKLSVKVRAGLTVLAVFALAFALATLVVRARPLSNILALVVAVASPYSLIVALLGFALSVLSRRVILSVFAVLLVTATFAVHAPRNFPRPTELIEAVEMRVLSSNLRLGLADSRSFVELAAKSADVISVSELTPEAVAGFEKAGLDHAFPFSIRHPAPGAGGIGLWSRYPLITVFPENPETAAARVQVPGVRLDPLVMSVHVFSPLAYDKDSVDGWEESIAGTQELLNQLTVTAGMAAVIVAGDFNSTPDMRQFRDLLTNGYQNAADQTGVGLLPTFPANSWMPPLLAIDHVLIKNATATSLSALTIAGSDHRALLATVRVPVDPTIS